MAARNEAAAAGSSISNSLTTSITHSRNTVCVLVRNSKPAVIAATSRPIAFGTFQFADLTAFEAGLPTQFTQRIGDPTVKYRQYQFGWYIQDDFRVRKNLTLSYGVRHELQNHVRGSSTSRRAWVLCGRRRRMVDHSARRRRNLLRLVRCANLRADFARRRPAAARSGRHESQFPESVHRRHRKQFRRRAGFRPIPTTDPLHHSSSFGVETNPFKLFRLTTNYQYQRGVHLLHGRNLNAPVPGLGRPDPTAGNITNIESSAYQSSHRLMMSIGPAKLRSRDSSGTSITC